MKEAVIDDNDVVRGLLEFANRNVIHSIVIGASTKNHLTRSFPSFYALYSCVIYAFVYHIYIHYYFYLKN